MIRISASPKAHVPTIPATRAHNPNPSVESAPLLHSPGQMCHVGFDGVAGGPGPGVHICDSVAPGLGMREGHVNCVTPADVPGEHDCAEDGEVLERVVHVCRDMC